MDKRIIAIATLTLGIVIPASALALESDSYKIPQFGIHSFGNSISSDNFGIRSSGAPIVGVANSDNYYLDTGFPAVTGSVVTLTLNSPTVDLGNLVPGSPVSGTTTSTVSTDSSAGYSLAISKAAPMTHTDTVTTIGDYGSDIDGPTTYSGTGLGFSVSAGTNVDPKWDNGNAFAAIPTASPTTYHILGQSISSPDDTTVTYKLNVPFSQQPGMYSTTVSVYAFALP